MAIEAVMLGAIKRSIKLAGKKISADIGTKAITDGQAVLINRLKTAPSKALYEFTARDLGISEGEVRDLVKAFNQTSKMKELSKGVYFKDLAQRKLKKELGVKGNDRIKDIINKAKEANAKSRKIMDGGINYNLDVKSLLTEIQIELEEKVDGLSGTENKHKQKDLFEIDVMMLYDKDNRYTFDTVRALEITLKNLYLDIERYTVGSDDDVALIEESTMKWGVYSRKAVQRYIDDVMDDIRIALNINRKSPVKTV